MGNVVPPERERWVILNLVALILAFAAFSFWMYRFTDWFPVFLGLFTLSGAFAWLAFLSHILTEARAKQIRDIFDRCVMQKCWFSGAVAFGVICFLFVAMSRGTLVLNGLRDEKTRAVAIHAAGQTSEAALRQVSLPAGASVNLSFWTGPFGEREIMVRPAGLPWRRVRVTAPFPRRFLDLPTSFRERAIVLIRPRAKDFRILAGAPERFALEIRLGETALKIAPYNGEAVLLGAPGDVELPREMIDSWRFEFAAAGVPSLAAMRWTTPNAMRPDEALEGGTVIRAWLRNKAGTKTGLEHLSKIAKSGMSAKFPIEMVIELPDG